MDLIYLACVSFLNIQAVNAIAIGPDIKANIQLALSLGTN